jgi:hypothetical protein
MVGSATLPLKVGITLLPFLEVFVQWKGVLADLKIMSVYQQIKKLVHDYKHINQTHQRKKVRIK